VVATVAAAVPVISLARPGRPALDALVGALAEVRQGDPLASATVLVPGPMAALHVRRALGRLGGVAAVDVVAPARLAERLAAAGVAASGRRPLPPGGWEEAVRVALAADPGPFRPVAHHPATVARVAAALRRLRPATAGERAALAAAHGRGSSRHLVRLLAAVEEATAGFSDHLAVVEAACAAVRSGIDPGPVVAFCPTGVDPGEAQLLGALSSAGRLRLVLAPSGDPSADEPVRRLAGSLTGASSEDWPAASPPLPQHLVLAPDAEAEARLAVQHVVAALEGGMAGHDLALLTFGGAAGLGRLTGLLDAAGVPWSGPAGHSLAASVPGRTLLGLLRLDTEGWTHAGVLAALGAGPVRRAPGSDPLPLGRLAALARHANVVGGAEQWQHRPAAAAADARRRGDQALAAELDDVAALAGELRTLLAPPQEAGWAALSSWAVAVLDHVLDQTSDGWPAGEVAAHAGVRAVAAGLAGLDGVVESGGRAGPTAADLVAALEARLAATAAPRHGRVGRGVLVATDPADLLGATPQLLLLAGVVEGAAPARRGADPLVTDAELQLVSGAPSRRDRRAATRAALDRALAGATRAVAFAHRADSQTARRPSRWFLGWAGALAGAPAPFSADELDATSAPWLTVVPSFAATATGPVAGSVQERRLAALAEAGEAGVASPIVREDAALGRAVRAALARRSDRFTAWDGLVAPGLALDAEVSASALEDWATCPQRYLFRHVLTVAATEAPGDALDVDGRDRGSLAHAVLASVVGRGLHRPPDQPWDEDDRARLRSELARRAEALRHRGALGRGVLADLRLDGLQASLLAALDLDDANRAEEGWVPVAVEAGFGEREGRPVAVHLPSGRTVRFRGRVDRVDEADGGRVRVVDYKTGSARRYVDAAGGGAAAARLLQLSVYEAAARATRPAGEVSSGWWLLDVVERDGRPAPIHPNHLSPAAFSAALDAIAAGIEGGAFPADPGEDGYRGPENCRFCPYDRVCRVDRVRALQRKGEDPALEPWRALRSVGQSVAEGDPGDDGGDGGGG
jgi:ATP-dependent helicase/nuclease subunit B